MIYIWHEQWKNGNGWQLVSDNPNHQPVAFPIHGRAIGEVGWWTRTEIRGECEAEKVKARDARDYAAALLKRARQVELRSIERGKYFRLVSTVVVDGQDLAEALIEARYGRTYNGGRRLGWCDE